LTGGGGVNADEMGGRRTLKLAADSWASRSAAAATLGRADSDVTAGLPSRGNPITGAPQDGRQPSREARNMAAATAELEGGAM